MIIYQKCLAEQGGFHSLAVKYRALAARTNLATFSPSAPPLTTSTTLPAPRAPSSKDPQPRPIAPQFATTRPSLPAISPSPSPVVNFSFAASASPSTSVSSFNSHCPL